MNFNKKLLALLAISLLNIIIKTCACEPLYNKLQKAVFENNLSVASEILSKEVINLDIQNKTGNTLLHTAISWGNKDMLKLLLDNGADSNIQNNDGNTAFFYENNKEILLLFLKNEADVNIANNEGINAFQRAVIEGIEEVVNLYLKYGNAKVNAKNPKTGNTALLYAIYHNHSAVMTILTDYNANPIIANNLGINAIGLANNYITRTFLSLAYIKSLLEKHKNDFIKASKEIKSRMKLNNVIVQELAKNTKVSFNEICDTNTSIKMDSDKTWLQQNIYDCYIVEQSVKKFNFPKLKPQKYQKLELEELQFLFKDLRASINMIKPLLSNFQYESIRLKMKAKAYHDISQGNV